MKIIEPDDKNHGHICKEFYDVSKNYEDGLMCIECHNILSKKWMEEHNINFKIVSNTHHIDAISLPLPDFSDRKPKFYPMLPRMNELNKIVDKILDSLKGKKDIKITKCNDLGLETILFEIIPNSEEIEKIKKEAYDEGYENGYQDCIKEGSQGY